MSLYSTHLGGANKYLNFLLLGLIEIPSYLVSPYLLNRLGRRWFVALCHLLAVLSFFATMFSGQSNIFDNADFHSQVNQSRLLCSLRTLKHGLDASPVISYSLWEVINYRLGSIQDDNVLPAKHFAPPKVVGVNVHMRYREARSRVCDVATRQIRHFERVHRTLRLLE